MNVILIVESVATLTGLCFFIACCYENYRKVRLEGLRGTIEQFKRVCRWRLRRSRGREKSWVRGLGIEIAPGRVESDENGVGMEQGTTIGSESRVFGEGTDEQRW